MIAQQNRLGELEKAYASANQLAEAQRLETAAALNQQAAASQSALDEAVRTEQSKQASLIQHAETVFGETTQQIQALEQRALQDAEKMQMLEAELLRTQATAANQIQTMQAQAGTAFSAQQQQLEATQAALETQKLHLGLAIQELQTAKTDPVMTTLVDDDPMPQLTSTSTAPLAIGSTKKKGVKFNKAERVKYLASLKAAAEKRTALITSTQKAIKKSSTAQVRGSALVVAAQAPTTLDHYAGYVDPVTGTQVL